MTNTKESLRFIDRFRKDAHEITKRKIKFIQRPRGRVPRLNSYFDFSSSDSISTGVAVVLAAEYERLKTLSLQAPFTVDLHKWNAQVFRTLYQLGFFEIVGITPKRDDVVIENDDTLTMQIVSARNADDLGRIDMALQSLIDFLRIPSEFSETLSIELLTGLSEAISNVTNHAYPPDFFPRYEHIGRLWVSATADRVKHTLTLVIYDQGASIPVTYPRVERGRRVMDFLGRVIKQRDEFEFENDGIYIRAALKYGGSRTDREYRGKGLPQMVSVLDRVGRGRIAVFSRGGWCYRERNGLLREGALPYSVGGTLVEWTLELLQPSKVDTL